MLLRKRLQILYWGALALLQVLVNAALVVDVNDAVLAEGTTLEYWLRLSSQPKSNVTLQALVSTTPARMASFVSIVPTSYSFSHADWQVPQRAVFFATQSEQVLGTFEGSVTYMMTSDDRNSSDLGAIAEDAFNFTIVEQNRRGILCAESNSVLSSASSSAIVTCSLMSEPQDAVTLSGDFLDTQLFSFHPQSLVWGPHNYSSPASAIVSGDLSSFRGQESSVLLLTASSPDLGYHGLIPISGGSIPFVGIGMNQLSVVAYFAQGAASEGTVATVQLFLSRAPAASVHIQLYHPELMVPLDGNHTVLNSTNWSVVQDISFYLSPGVIAAHGGSLLNVSVSATSSASQSVVPVLPNHVIPLQVFIPSAACQLQCPAGSFAVEVDEQLVCQECLPGHFCLGGCSRQSQCPAGTYANQTGLKSELACSNCPSGFFASQPASAKCNECPANFLCPIAASSPEPCPVGSTSEAGSTLCVTCPAGHSCLPTMTGVQNCPAGTYGANGSITCISCPPGHQCSGTTDLPQVCKEGYFSGPGQALCSLCPQGTYTSTNSSSDCTDCPPGHKCTAGATKPAKCPSGTYSAGVSHQCLVCPLGTYSNNTASELCLPCPTGAACPSRDARPVSCPLGSVSMQLDYRCNRCPLGSIADGAQETCVLCPVGHECPSPSSLPRACSPGTYTNQSAGASACDVCPLGYSCPGLDATPLRCPVNLFPVHANTSCGPCPAGFQCSYGDSGILKEICALGTFQDGSTSSCQRCPPGFVCPTPEQTPNACPAHTIPNANSTACRACLPGHACSSSSEVKCSPGEYWDQRSHCLQCPAGHMCSNPTMAPVPCPAGTFQVQHSMQNCTICPAGYACQGATSVLEVCPAGFVSPVASASCTPCPAGYECPDHEWDHISTCHPGTVSLAGEVQCFPCPPGKECPYTTSAVQRDCTSGRYSTGGQANCQLCPAGFACDDPAGGLISACPPEQVSPVGYATCISPSPFTSSNLDSIGGCGPGTFAQNSTHCTNCPAGQACPKTGAAFSVFCQAGFFSTGGQATCTPCPPGFYCTDTTLATMTSCQPGRYSTGGQSECKVCPPGHFCELGTELPHKCSAGRYSMQEAAICTNCPAGSYCSLYAGAVSFPQLCPRGTWSLESAIKCEPSHPGFVSPLGAVAGSDPAWAVPAGRYQQYETSLEFGVISLAVLCPPGRFGDEGGTGSIAAGCPFTCPAGSFCVAGTSNNTIPTCPPGSFCEAGEDWPALCPTGRYSASSGNSALSDCAVCPAGRACPSSGTVTPIGCFAGYYCPTSSTSATMHPCPAGTFQPDGEQESASSCRSCPVGAYCTTGSGSPVLCPVGTYSNLVNLTHVQQCLPCPAGVVCSRRGLLQPDGMCAAGYFCPRGSGNRFDYACPAGRYTHKENLTSPSECDECPPGFACRPGTGGAQPMVECPAGYFCPNGTMDPHVFKCPAGTFSARPALTNKGQCDFCPPGRFCTGGMTAPSGPCAHGHYCPQSTERATQFPCPAGTYADRGNFTSLDDCQVCPIARYCPTASAMPIDCPAGTFSNQTGLRTANWLSGEVLTCEACPAGKFCPIRSFEPLPCPPGSFSPSNSTRCSSCPSGHYCPAVNTTMTAVSQNACPAGTFCPAGTATVVQETHNCSRGHFCPEAALDEIPCSPGTYAPFRGMHTCMMCPAGQYCLAASIEPTGECRAGHYCPAGSSSAEAEWCPMGTYNPIMGASSIGACSECPAGFFCGGGTATPVACPAGSFCPPLSWHPQPCPSGTFGNSSGLRHQLDCTPCLLGMFCDESGLKAPVGLCDPGFFCTRGSPTSSPTSPGPPWVEQDFAYGGVCPRGGFCPSGSFEATPCPPGTYSNTSGAANHEECQRCPAGFYCAFTAKPEPTGPCLAGYFCEVGSNSSRQHVAPRGHYAPIGSASPTKCQPGYFGASEGMAECDACPSGYECPIEGVQAPSLCDSGTFCPVGTDVAQLCPAGTFSPQTGAGNATACLPCPAGKFCQFSGLSDPTGDCQAGFICSGGSSLPDPDQRQGGYICPQGAFCPAAAASPHHCPSGTFNPVQGSTSEASCVPCSPGHFCSVTGLTQPEGLCAAGFFCGSGSASATPMGTQGSNMNGVCSVGYQCAIGTSVPAACRPGTFSNTTHARECEVCPAGYACPDSGTSKPIRCLEGQYCPVSSIYPKHCPAGTYSSQQRLEAKTDCARCPLGKVCSLPGLPQPDGECAAGFWCKGGAITVRGHQTANNTAQNSSSFCPPGSYCPVGVEYPLQCPPGTASSSIGLESIIGCSLCPPGQFCKHAGLLTPSGDCEAGHYCVVGSATSTPTNVSFNVQLSANMGGFVCPEGHFCPRGSVGPSPCPEGTHMPAIGSHGPCNDCPAGYTCTSATVYPISLCPVGHYCLQGTGSLTVKPCWPGTFNPQLGGVNSSACQSCTPGMYCAQSASVVPGGLCREGFFCGGGAAVSTPADSGINGRCPPGTICPAGTVEPIDCPAGYYCANGQSNTTGQCAPGFFCQRASPVSRPVQLEDSDGFVGDLCPRGSFCPIGTQSPIKCPVGSYNAAFGAQWISDCLECPSGRVCPSPGVVVPELCAAGYVCKGGDSVSNVACPAGHFCPQGSKEGSPCWPGFFANVTGLAACQGCPEGFMCPLPQTVTPQLCVQGHYCPANTSSAAATKCPVGRYGSTVGLKQAHECALCPAGSYCSELGGVAPTGLCAEGFFCRSGATAEKPTSSSTLGYQCAQLLSFPSHSAVGPFSYAPWAAADGCESAALWTNSSLFAESTGGPCPQGHFCPTGSSHPQPCPAGRFGPSAALGSLADCELCAAGHYCPIQASVLSGPLCPAGYICPEGSDTPQPDCTVGHFCPEGSSHPTPCAAGRYSPSAGVIPKCTACPPGSMCNFGAIHPESCPRGFACPGNSSATSAQPCPPGSFGELYSTRSIAECTPCSPGYFCPGQGATNPFGLVLAGFFSRGGAASATPVQADGRGPCSAGHFCPEGAPSPSPCPPGTFSPQQGLFSAHQCTLCALGTLCATQGLVTNLLPCPQLHFCPVGTANISSETLCPISHTCPEGTLAPIPCPAGTYTAGLGSASCTLCPSGKACTLGDPLPSDCLPGRYCPEGTAPSTQQECPPGTFRDTPGGSSAFDCRACTPGSFCPVSGAAAPVGLCKGGHFCVLSAQSSMPTDSHTGGECDAGYVCPPGSSSPTPDGTGVGYPCPAGHFCPRATAVPAPCEAGTFRSVVGGAVCAPCPAGSFCPEGSTHPQQCLPGNFCPKGSKTGSICPAGTHSLVFGLQSASQCEQCPPGRYCNGGTIRGPCSAGFVCFGGASVSRPTQDMQGGMECPPGNFCPEGALAPVLCANGTFRGSTGGTRQEDCGACEPGFICFDGDPAPHLCPSGFYCNSVVVSAPCPAGTFQPLQGASDRSSCSVCPAGYFCPDMGMANFTASVCPPGHFCPAGSLSPAACPPGSRAPARGTQSIQSCEMCPPGMVCASNATIFGDTCPGGFECPAGTVWPSPCGPGLLCPAGSATAAQCPAGYFCQPQSSRPKVCGPGSYCARGSMLPTPCPAGFKVRSPTYPGVFTSLEDACEICPAGTTSSENGTFCKDCNGGYICLEGSTSFRPSSIAEQSGYMCPAGQYCPPGALRPIPCPAGTFNSFMGMSAFQDCLVCPINTYSAVPGSTGCELCSASAVSSPGSFECKCIGFKRAYQASDGQCICEPGFEFVDEQFNRIADEDGTGDCQPVVFSRCLVGQARSSSGACVSDCAAECGSQGGKLVGSSGVCECAGTPSLEIVCDAECRRKADRQVLIEASNQEEQSQRYVVILRYDMQLQQDRSYVYTWSQWGLSGNSACVGQQADLGSELEAAAEMQSAGRNVANASLASAWCSMEQIQVHSGVFFGTYQQRPLAAPTFELALIGDSIAIRPATADRRLQATQSTELQRVEIANPIICLQAFDSIVFDIAGSGSWPVYDKDSLLNTNPSFDYGAFRGLQKDMQSGANVSSFIFTFIAPGVHTFTSSSRAASRIIVRVVPEGVHCPANTGSILPASEQSLILVGIKVNDKLLTDVDWNKVVAVVCVICFVAIALVWFSQSQVLQDWTRQSFSFLQYRRGNKAMDFGLYHSKGGINSIHMRSENAGAKPPGKQLGHQSATKSTPSGHHESEAAHGDDLFAKKEHHTPFCSAVLLPRRLALKSVNVQAWEGDEISMADTMEAVQLHRLYSEKALSSTVGVQLGLIDQVRLRFQSLGRQVQVSHASHRNSAVLAAAGTDAASLNCEQRQFIQKAQACLEPLQQAVDCSLSIDIHLVRCLGMVAELGGMDMNSFRALDLRAKTQLCLEKLICSISDIADEGLKELLDDMLRVKQAAKATSPKPVRLADVLTASLPDVNSPPSSPPRRLSLFAALSTRSFSGPSLSASPLPVAHSPVQRQHAHDGNTAVSVNDTGPGWGLDSKVSTEKIMPLSLFQQHAALRDLYSELEALGACVERALLLQASLELHNVQNLHALWVYAPTYAQSDDLRKSKAISELVGLAQTFLADFQGSRVALVNFSILTKEVLEQFHDSKRRLAQSTSNLALDTLQDMFAAEAVQGVRRDLVLSQKHRGNARASIGCCWDSCSHLRDRMRPVNLAATAMKQALAQATDSLAFRLHSENSQSHQNAKAQGLSYFRFNQRLQTLEELVGHLNAQQYYEDEAIEGDTGIYYGEEEDNAELAEDNVDEQKQPEMAGTFSDDQFNEAHAQEMQELQTEQYLSDDAKHRLLNDLADDAGELQQVLQAEYEQQQYELNSALAQHADNEIDEQMQRFLNEAEFIDDQEAAVISLDEHQEQELEAALQSMLDGDEFEEGRKSFFEATTWDGQEESMSEYTALGAGLVQTGGADQALLDAERIRNERNAEAASCEARQQREQTRQLQALKRKLEARKLARMAALDRKLASDAEQGYSEADAAYLAGEATVKANEQAAADETELIRMYEQTKIESHAAVSRELARSTLQQFEEVAANLNAAESAAAASLSSAERTIQAKLNSIQHRIREELTKVVDSKEQQMLESELAAAQEQAAKELASATAEVHQRMVAMKTAMQVEQANAMAFKEAHDVSEKLNTDLQAQLDRQRKEMTAAQDELRAQHQAELDRLRLQQQGELAAARSDTEAEAFSARHQLEEEQLKAISMVQRHERLGRIEAAHATEQDSLRQQADKALADFTKNQTESAIARADAQKQQLGALQVKLQRRQERRALAAKQRHAHELAQAEQNGQDTDAIKLKLDAEEAATAAQEQAVLNKISQVDSFAAETAAVNSAASRLTQITQLIDAGQKTHNSASGAEQHSERAAQHHLQQVEAAISRFNTAMASGDAEGAAQRAFHAASELAETRQRGELDRVKSAREQYLAGVAAEEQREKDFMLQAKLIQEQYVREQQYLVNTIGTEKMRQANAAHERMLERKRRRAEKLEKEQSEHRAQLIEEQKRTLAERLRSKPQPEDQHIESNVAALVAEVHAEVQASAPGQTTEEVNDAIGRHEAKMAALRQKHNSELEKLRKAADTQAALAAQEATEAAERRRQERLKILADEMKDQQQWGSSQEQADAIKQKYEEDVAQLSAALDEERERQQNQLQQQLSVRKQRQLRKAQKRQELELSQLAREQEANIAAIQSTGDKKRDLAALRRVLATAGASTAKQRGAAIEGVLRTRHRNETQSMLERQFHERNTRLKASVGSILQDKAGEKRETLSMLEESGAAPDEMEAALADLNDKYSHTIQVMTQDIHAELEAKHAAELAELRRAQMAELTDAFAQLSPQDVLRRQQAAEREEQAAQMEATKKRLLLEREKKLEAAGRLRERKQAEMQRAKEAAQEQLRSEMSAHLKTEERRASLQMQRQKERAEREAEEHMQQQLVMHDGDEEYKQKLLQEFKRNQAAMSVALSTERQRQAKVMHDRLAKRKERKLRATERRIEQASRVAEKAELDRKAATRTRVGADSKPKAKPVKQASSPGSRVTPQRSVRGKATPMGRPPRPQLAGAAAGKAISQAVLGRIEKIETALQGLTQQTAAILPMQQAPAQASADVFEAHLACGSTLKKKLPSQLSREQHHVLHVAADLFRTISASMNTSGRLSECRLQVAAELPSALVDSNAFRRSYWFDAEANILYIHEKRLEMAAGLPFVLVHAAAHILSDPATMGPDSSPAFQSMHAQVMQAALGQLMSRAHQQASSPAHLTLVSDSAILSPAQASAGDDVPQLVLNFGLTDTGTGTASSSPLHREKQPVRSERAAKLFRSLSSRSKLFQVGAAAAARKRVLQLDQGASEAQ